MSLDADQRELLAERIAIMVVDGGLEPAEAERLARACIPSKQTPKQEAPEQMTLIEPDYRQHLREFYKK